MSERKLGDKFGTGYTVRHGQNCQLSTYSRVSDVRLLKFVGPLTNFYERLYTFLRHALTHFSTTVDDYLDSFVNDCKLCDYHVIPGILRFCPN